MRRGVPVRNAPMTTAGREEPFRIGINHGGRKGLILLDQVRTVDKTRLAKRLGVASAKTLTATLRTLLAGKVAGSLKPGGIVVMECAADWVGRNEMLRLFDALQIVRYEIVTSKSDFYNRGDMEVLRLVARKPAK